MCNYQLLARDKRGGVEFRMKKGKKRITDLKQKFNKMDQCLRRAFRYEKWLTHAPECQQKTKSKNSHLHLL